MALATKLWMSSGVRAAGLNASFEARGTAGSSVTMSGAVMVFTGGDMNTGRCEFGLVARIEGDRGFEGSATGVTPGDVDTVIGVATEEAKWVWWWWW